MGDTFPEGYFEDSKEYKLLKKFNLLQEEIKGIKESLEDLTERVSRIEERHNIEDFIFYKRHKEDVEGDFSPMSEEDTKKHMQS